MAPSASTSLAPATITKSTAHSTVLTIANSSTSAPSKLPFNYYFSHRTIAFNPSSTTTFTITAIDSTNSSSAFAFDSRMPSIGSSVATLAAPGLPSFALAIVVIVVVIRPSSIIITTTGPQRQLLLSPSTEKPMIIDST